MRIYDPSRIGKAYFEILYFDKDGNITKDDKNAEKCVIRQCRCDDTVVHEKTMDMREDSKKTSIWK